MKSFLLAFTLTVSCVSLALAQSVVILHSDGKPLEFSTSLDPQKIANYVDEGIWNKSDLEAQSLVAAKKFVVPEGKVKIGEPKYVKRDSEWFEEFDVEDAPPPAAPLTTEEKIEALLNEHGLTAEEFKDWIAK